MNTAGTNVLCADQVSYQTGEQRLVKDISLKVDAGQVCIVIGENGAGKTTLLDVFAGDLVLTSGQLKLGKNDISELSLEALARRRAYLKQRQQLAFDFTATDVVSLGRLPFAEDRHLVAEVIEAMGLGDLRDRLYTRLSGGEQQRVQVARVLAQVWEAENKLCLLDEPIASLDVRHQMRLVSVLRQLADQGLAIVMVMHDLRMAARHADHLVLLSEGAILSQGAVNDVMTDENIGNAFGIEADALFNSGKIHT